MRLQGLPSDGRPVPSASRDPRAGDVVVSRAGVPASWSGGNMEQAGARGENRGMPMNHGDAFLQALIDNPDDDAIRLVYCDWLEEHGQPDRAAFIRVQVALARLPHGDPRRQVLEARERELLARQDQWLGRLN